MATTLVDLTDRVPEPASPLVTYYDFTTGERVELSAVTCANWVAKTANFLIDEVETEIGSRIRIALPSHWLRAVWLLSAWQVGAVVVDREAHVGVVGPELDADEPVRLASALLPFGVRFPEPPADFVDLGVEINSHPDVFVSLDPPSTSDVAIDLPGLQATHGELAAIEPDGRRLLLGDGDVARDARLLVAACLGGGSLVLTHGGTDADRERVAVQEQATVWSPTV